MAKRNDYWARRMTKVQNAITDKSIAETDKQLIKYYQQTMESVTNDFVLTYHHILAAQEAGRAPTPADLYKLDKYWKMQANLRAKLQKLGDKSVKVMSNRFQQQYINIYNCFALDSGKMLGKADKTIAKQMINQIWCADGKMWSQRVWNNRDKLAEALNQNLIKCVVSGKNPTFLQNLLQETFNVSYHRAHTIVTTELAHIQTQAATDRYKDAGCKYYEYYAEDDSNDCDDCSALDGERFLLTDMIVGENAPPLHPNCRCCILPVVD